MVPGEPRGVRRRHGEPVRSVGRARGVTPSRPASAADFRKLLGRKLSLRYALSDESGYSSTEAIGVLMSVSDDGDAISLVGRRGNTRTIEISGIQAAKVFPA